MVTFKSSYNLAAAYGIAINLDMLITTALVCVIAYMCWNWNLLKLIIFPLIFLVELSFLGGNIPKFFHGGWIPIVIAFLSIVIMYAWHCGFQKLCEMHHRNTLMDQFIIDELNQNKITKQHGTGLYIVDPYDKDGGSLLNYLRINRIFFDNMIFICVKTENRPFIPLADKHELIKVAKGLYLLNVHFGFTEEINLPVTLNEIFKSIKLPFEINKEKLVYFVELISVETTKVKTKGIWNWQKYLFAIMLRNAVPDIRFYSLPYKQTIALGAYYQI